MPDVINDFLDALDYYDAKDAVLSDSKVQNLVNNARNFGFDLLETFQQWVQKDKSEACYNSSVRKPPLIPQGIVRTTSETAFLEPKNVTSLDEVTKPVLKEYTTFSNIFNNISYGVRDLSVTATYKDDSHNSKYTLRAGDKFGLQYRHNDGVVTYDAGLEQNIFSGRTRANFSISNPYSSYNLSVYQQNKNIGVTFGYSNNSGLSTAISGDTNGAALSVGYTHQYTDCTLNVRGFISTQKQNLDTFSTKNYSSLIGICGTISM